MFLPTDEKQFTFWAMRRGGMANIAIAKELGISRQAVSRALILMNERIETILRDMAKANSISVEKINPERGVLIGRSIPFKTAAIIFVSEKHGVQVWFEHEGDCENCERYKEYIELLWDYAGELGVKIEKTDDPTRMADELFEKVRAIV